MTSRWVTILLASYTSEPVDKHVPPAGSVQKMTKEQLSCEKTVLQKNLLHYEGLHGRPVSCLLPQLFSGFRLIYLFKFKFYFLLGFFLSSFSNQVTREERLVVKPLYDRYRLVKQMLTRVSITPVTVSSSLWCR